ncbi:MAG TPA: hypothetical protein VGJ05_14440 [Fimbriiglobus sp.]|jgi:hypothetical protein
MPLSVVSSIRLPNTLVVGGDRTNSGDNFAHDEQHEPATELAADDIATDIVDTLPIESVRQYKIERSIVPAGTSGPVEPIPEYLQLSVPEILKFVHTLNTDGIAQVIAFEKAHRNRKTLLIKLGRMVRQSNSRTVHSPENAPPTANIS